MISTEQVKDLRDRTGISVMQCKKALEEANGDVEKALILLKKKGADVAGKKADRVFKAGTIASYVHGAGTVASMVLLRCETDFVARNEEFRDLAYSIAMQIAATKPEYIKMEDVTEEAKISVMKAFEKDVTGKTGDMKEKILAGKVAAYFKERVLLEQPYIKNEEQTVSELLSSAIQKFGEKIDIGQYTRFAVEVQ